MMKTTTNLDAIDKISNLVSSILSRMQDITKPRKDFLLRLFVLYCGLRSRYNFMNMSRYGNYCEQTYRHHFSRSFDYLTFNSQVAGEVGSGHHILAFDPCYIPKSGKHTPGLGKFWSGSAGQALKGLEIGGLALVDVDHNTAMSLEAIQTPSADKLKKQGCSLIDHYCQLILNRSEQLISQARYLTVDGYFARQGFINPVCEQAELEVISKLRQDADLMYLYEGPQTNGRGRPRKYDGKVNVSRIDKNKIRYCGSDDNKRLYSGVVYSRRLKRKIRITYVEETGQKGASGQYAILFSTDTQLDGYWIYRYYKARFQIEFLFRDAKQHCGLNHCQARSLNKLHFHFNASLTAVSLAKAAHWLNNDETRTSSFSMANIKTLYINKTLVDRIFDNLDIEISPQKIRTIYEKTLSIGKIAA